MFHKPAHKQIGPNGPGQVINDITLGDYLERKYPEETKKKLTFDEWWEQGGYAQIGYNDIWGEIVWKAAQENV